MVCDNLPCGVYLYAAEKTCRTNVVGSGLKLKSQIDFEFLGMTEDEARELERKIEQEFSAAIARSKIFMPCAPFTVHGG